MIETTREAVLIVEGDRALAGSLCAVVEVSGYSATATPEAEEALKMIYGGKVFRAILVAYSLPRLSGADFCAVYRGLDHVSPSILIGMSSKHSNKLEMLAAGANAFLTKPFSMLALKEVLLNADFVEG